MARVRRDPDPRRDRDPGECAAWWEAFQDEHPSCEQSFHEFRAHHPESRTPWEDWLDTKPDCTERPWEEFLDAHPHCRADDRDRDPRDGRDRDPRRDHRPLPAVRPKGVGTYTVAPSLAWSGWRLRNPGGPYGGQYHGYIASDDIVDGVGWPAGRDEIYRAGGYHDNRGMGGTADPWTSVWGGTALREGENLSDHVYRSPAELRPRPNASGGTNVVRAAQTRRSAGFAVAPGNYRGIGGLGIPYWVGDGEAPGGWRTFNPIDYRTPLVAQPPPPTFPQPGPTIPCPTPNQYRDAAGNCTSDWRNPYPLYLPVQVPRPAPTVAAQPKDFLPTQGQPVDGLTPSPSALSSITDWFGQSSVINGVPNWALVAGAAFLLMRGGRGR